MDPINIEITEEQRMKLNDLWYIYGNNGSKHTHGNHKFIQWLLEMHMYNPDALFSQYRINHPAYEPLTQECKHKVDEILGLISPT